MGEWRWAIEHGDATRVLRAKAEIRRLGAAVVPALVTLLDGWPEGAPHVANVLGDIPSVPSVEALGQILDGAAHATDTQARSAALHALARIGGDRARACFRDHMARETDEGVLSAALAVAPAILTPADVDQLPEPLAARVRAAFAARGDSAELLERMRSAEAKDWTADKWAEFLQPGCSMAIAGIAAAKLEQRGDNDAIAVLRAIALRHDDNGALALAALCRMRLNVARGAVREALASVPADRLPAVLDIVAAPSGA